MEMMKWTEEVHSKTQPSDANQNTPSAHVLLILKYNVIIISMDSGYHKRHK